MKKNLPDYNKIILLGSNGSVGRSLKFFFYKKKISCISLDLPNYDLTKKKFKLNYKKFPKKFNYTIVNCAGLMGADKSQKQIKKFFSVNGLSVDNIFEHFKELNINKIIHLSSETVYGSGKNLRENSIKKPFHPYAISKLIAEMIFEKKKKINNVKSGIIVIRLPVVIFKNQKFHNTLSIMCKDAKDGKKLIIFGNGKHYRKYIHENDLCEIISLLIKYQQKKYIEIFNVQGFVANTLKIVDEIKRYKRKLKVEFVQNNNKSFTLTSNSKKIENIINYKLKMDLKKIISKSL